MHDIRDTINQWLNEGHTVALATVVHTWGSSPRQIGAHMAVIADMRMIGSVSGGCVEADVVRQALLTLEDKQPRLLDYQVSDETALDVGLSCGGNMSVLVEPLDLEWWERLALNERQATVTILNQSAQGQKALFGADGNVLYQTTPITSEMKAVVKETFKDGQSSRQTVGDHDIIVDLHLPLPHLIIVGGSHIAVALQSLAHTVGFRVSLIDPRKAFATIERFPSVAHLYHQYPDQVLPDVELGPDAFLVAVSHDPKIDDPALIAALGADIGYVGVMSSRRTHRLRLERLRAKGLSDGQLARIHTPVGLNINAQTPEEIALSIMAEVVAVRNGALL